MRLWSFYRQVEFILVFPFFDLVVEIPLKKLGLPLDRAFLDDACLMGLGVLAF
jgi:hypothetical protein